MGVIYVVAEASKHGFWNGHPDWANLGQGQPEVGEMEGAPPRFSSVSIEPGDHAYGPLGGPEAFRESVARHYNRLYPRKGSPYTAANVSATCGGRLALTRVFAALGKIRLGYVVPDYTAYEDMIDYHRHRVTPVLLPTRPENGFTLLPADFERTVVEERLGAIVMSNPCNPTGRVIAGKDLAEFVRIARAHDCMLILDEFYSHFIYDPKGGPGAGPVSAAAFVEDVERDPVLLIDGLTKCFRYPGWRVGWAVGPRSVIETIGRAASAIDGGPSQPLLRAAREVLEPARADQETTALRKVFSTKRDLMVESLKRMGIRPCPETQATFYTWASLAELPPPLDDGETFFREALNHKVMTVPGVFFDVNPGKERKDSSPYRKWMRFSFGPPLQTVKMGLERLDAMIASARAKARSR
jgi:hypothetical protein